MSAFEKTGVLAVVPPFTEAEAGIAWDLVLVSFPVDFDDGFVHVGARTPVPDHSTLSAMPFQNIAGGQDEG